MSIFRGLTGVGYDMCCDAFTVSTVDVPAVVDLLQHSLRGDSAYDHTVLGQLLLLGLSAALIIICPGLTARPGCC